MGSLRSKNMGSNLIDSEVHLLIFTILIKIAAHVSYSPQAVVWTNSKLFPHNFGTEIAWA